MFFWVELPFYKLCSSSKTRILVVRIWVIWLVLCSFQEGQTVGTFWADCFHCVIALIRCVLSSYLLSSLGGAGHQSLNAWVLTSHGNVKPTSEPYLRPCSRVLSLFILLCVWITSFSLSSGLAFAKAIFVLEPQLQIYSPLPGSSYFQQP